MKYTNLINRKFVLRILAVLVLTFWGALFIGCENCDDCRVVAVDDTPPDAPQGVYSVTGDEAVYIYWYESPEPDLDHYWVWRSEEDMVDNEGRYYERKWKVYDNSYVDYAVENGETYYYAVTAVDNSGNESYDLSYDHVQDTPRPEGSEVLYDVHVYPESSGFDFKRAAIFSPEHPATDIFFEYDSDLGAFFVWAVVDFDDERYTDIQDYGYTESLDELDWAPPDGWSRVGWLEVIPGHSYYVWTDDDHYAKFRVDDVDLYPGGGVEISWAYQTVQSWPELVPPQRPEHSPEYGSGKKIADTSHLK